jgi:hypothetical protein
MSKDTVLAILVVPVGIGGAVIWATPSKDLPKKRLLIGSIVVYDLIAFAISHWWLKLL